MRCLVEKLFDLPGKTLFLEVWLGQAMSDSSCTSFCCAATAGCNIRFATFGPAVCLVLPVLVENRAVVLVGCSVFCDYRTVLVEDGVVITSEVYPHLPTICVRCGSEARVDGGGQTREPLAMVFFWANDFFDAVGPLY